MATYVISDIHGEYGKFMELLDIIHFSYEDILYVLGDVVDRGKNPVKTLLKMMEMPNVIPIAGNHEQMMLECMSVLINEVKDENSIKEFAEKFSDDMFQKLYAWQRNGGIATTDELSKLDNETRKDGLDYVADFSWYEKVEVNVQTFYPACFSGIFRCVYIIRCLPFPHITDSFINSGMHKYSIAFRVISWQAAQPAYV